ncbi:DUF6527 family protein [Sulfuricurvum sp.]|uniref:DUF6527 family protein n=1 Tax=Sulfuricurvum sp. TaxID=2025608 RepID=UPI00286DE27C|nr:DUF6527 family protein [Sulfuricurvum sp.]
MQHEFVTLMPKKLEEGVLYISIEYKTATHLCACGCRSKVVTSITPTGWTLSYNGDSVSLNPSIGSWSLSCQSHYWIKNGQVIWAESWTKEQIDAVKHKDMVDKAKYFNNKIDLVESQNKSPKFRTKVWSKIKSLFS